MTDRTGMDAALDHLAIRVADREAAAAQLVGTFDMEVIERTDRFTLIGADFDHGKITLLDAAADGPAPIPARLISIVLAERSDEEAARPPIQLDTGLVVSFAGPAELDAEVPRHALVGVSLRSADPARAAAMLAELHGMHVEASRPDVAVLTVGDGPASGRITLSRERFVREEGTTPMLDHVGIRVASAAEWRTHAEETGIDVVRWVEAPHSLAVFVAGPEELLVEYVEHTAPIGVS